VRVCPPSALLPHIDSIGTSEVGTSLHQHAEQRSKVGVDAALAPDALEAISTANRLSAEDARRFVSRARGWTWTPPASALSEVALGLTRSGAAPVDGGQGRYDLADIHAPFAATIDLLHAEPYSFDFDYDDVLGESRPVVPAGAALHVTDFKSGGEDGAEPVDHNAQVRMGAALAARWVRWEDPDRISVIPSLLWIRKGPGTLEQGKPLDQDAIAAELRALGAEVRAIREQERLLAAGQPLTGLVEGPHCTYCPARTSCPAKTASVARLLTGEPGMLVPGALGPDKLSRAVTLLPMLASLEKQIRDLARGYVEATGAPLTVGGGKVYGPKAKTSHELDPIKAWDLLEDVLGRAGAAEAAPRVISRASIRRVLEARGLPPAEVEQKLALIYGRAKGMGALVEVPETQWRVHRPEADADLASLLSAAYKATTGATVGGGDVHVAGAPLVPAAKPRRSRKPKGQVAEKENPWTKPLPGAPAPRVLFPCTACGTPLAAPGAPCTRCLTDPNTTAQLGGHVMPVAGMRFDEEKTDAEAVPTGNLGRSDELDPANQTPEIDTVVVAPVDRPDTAPVTPPAPEECLHAVVRVDRELGPICSGCGAALVGRSRDEHVTWALASAELAVELGPDTLDPLELICGRAFRMAQDAPRPPPVTLAPHRDGAALALRAPEVETRALDLLVQYELGATWSTLQLKGVARSDLFALAHAGLLERTARDPRWHVTVAGRGAAFGRVLEVATSPPKKKRRSRVRKAS
jgi:hypothetical protein